MATWTVLLLVLSWTTFSTAEQEVFKIPLNVHGADQTPAGYLQRFEVNDHSVASEILYAIDKYDLDVWHTTTTSIDIYSPISSPLPESLQAIHHTSSPVNRSMKTLPTISEWSLASLENSSYHATYHPLFEIDQFIYEISELHPTITQVIRLGHSSQGREMLGLKISQDIGSGFEAESSPPSKLGFVVVGTLHAREWVATAASLYIAHALVSNSSEPHSLRSLLDTYDFYVIPSPNPDGYEYTWEIDRFWYKNRQILGPNAKCVGLDMNRNWGYKWKPDAVGPSFMDSESRDMEDDLSKTKKKKKIPKPPADPCSHWYPGHRPFESSEVNNIANYITTLPNLVAFIDLRSYGQMLSAPYSFSCKKIPKDAEDQIEAAHGAAFALRSVHGTQFTAGTLCQLLYKAPGNMIDWMYKRAGIKYSYAAHLRDTGTYGFALPPEWIRPVGEETGGMVKYLAEFIARRIAQN